LQESRQQQSRRQGQGQHQAQQAPSRPTAANLLRWGTSWRGHKGPRPGDPRQISGGEGRQWGHRALRGMAGGVLAMEQ
jgi:hypothetical protein